MFAVYHVARCIDTRSRYEGLSGQDNERLTRSTESQCKATRRRETTLVTQGCWDMFFFLCMLYRHDLHRS